MMKQLAYLLFFVSSFGVAGSWADLSKPNNWDDSFKRWSRGDGAWKNWRDWGKNDQGNRKPWKAMNDIGADMAAEAMGDAVQQVEFEWWVKANFKAKSWYSLDKKSRYNVYDYWRSYVWPFQQYQRSKSYYPEQPYYR